MKRRNFIKTTAAGSAFIMTSGAFALGNPLNQSKKFCYQSERKIPVAYHVDVAVIGGSLAAVAAAVEAKKSGAKVFLAAQEPYLGEDVCGTFRMWTDDNSIAGTELGKQIFSNGLPTPTHVKRTLDNALIDNNIDFLYSSYVTDILSDENGQPTGVVISNRSGRQAIVAKTIIDATPRAMVARMAGVQFGSYPAGKQTFQFTVLGNHLKEAPGLSGKIHREQVLIKPASNGNTQGSGFSEVGIRYKAIEYYIQIHMKDGSWASFAEAEQKARDLTWDSDQVESADLIFQNPPDKMVGRKKWNNADVDSENINLKVFQPRKLKNLFVLSGSANLSEAAAETLLQPGKLIRIGERIGKEAAFIAGGLAAPQTAKIKGVQQENPVSGDVNEILEGLRPSLNMGEIVAEKTSLPVLGIYDVVVMGGGTAGAPAAVGVARQGAKTLVLDYMHGLRGMGTLGMVGKYYHGYRKGYTNTVDLGVKNMDPDNQRQKKSLASWVFDWKTDR